MSRKIVAQRLHAFLITSRQVYVRYLVETNEVDSAFQALQQSDDLTGMCHTVVEPTKADILKRAATLMGEIILTQQIDGLCDAHLTLCGHQHLALFGQGRVHRDGHMAFTLVEEPLEFVFDADTVHGDAFRTPCPAVVGCENLCGPEHVVEIVHRLALTHEDDIRQLVALRQGVDLIQNISSCEVALKALLARLTEETIHLAANLAGNAECGSVIIWDKDGLDELLGISRSGFSRPHREEIFDGTIF